MTLEIANRLLSLRKQYNFSQEQLAEKLGVSRQAVSKWERAEASPNTDSLILLATLYNVSLDTLLNISPETLADTYEHCDTEIVYNNQDDDLYEEYPKLKSKISSQSNFPDSSFEDIQFFKGDNSNTITDDIGLFKNTPIEDDINNVPNFSTTYEQNNSISISNTSTPPTPLYKNKSFLTFCDNFFRTKAFLFIFRGFPFISAIFTALWCGFLDISGFAYTSYYYVDCFALAVTVGVLNIPLFYTTVFAIRKRNPKFFGYPIIAIMAIVFLASFSSGIEWLVVVVVFSVPLYYILVSVLNSHKRN